jgi:hypothetical protein
VKFKIGDIITCDGDNPARFKIIGIGFEVTLYYCLYLNNLEWDMRNWYSPEDLKDFYLFNKKKDHPLTRIFK